MAKSSDHTEHSPVGSPQIGVSHLHRFGCWLRMHRRRLATSLGVLVALSFVSLVAVGWYYSNVFEDQALAVHHGPPRYDLRVSDVGNGRVTLRTTSSSDAQGLWRTPETFGLEWQGGYGQIGQIHELHPRDVTRDFTLLEGSLPDGTPVRIDTYAFPSDPLTGLGLAYQEVAFESPLGPMAAWFVDGPTDTWAILVHGQGANRRDMLRPLQAVHAAGLKALVISYRNDEGAPPERDQQNHYGETEWQDLDAAAGYAIAHGAKTLVPVGHSMGGAIVMSFLYKSHLASTVSAVVLDSPMLDFKTTIRWRAEGLAPGPLITYGMWVSGLRFGIDWGKLNYLAQADHLVAPILVFHGDADEKVPLVTSQELQRRRPDLVTLITWPGVGHVRSWNFDPAAYRAAVVTFLSTAAIEP